MFSLALNSTQRQAHNILHAEYKSVFFFFFVIPIKYDAYVSFSVCCLLLWLLVWSLLDITGYVLSVK